MRCASGRHFHDNVRNERFIVILLFQLSLTAHFRCTRACVCVCVCTLTALACLSVILTGPNIRVRFNMYRSESNRTSLPLFILALQLNLPIILLDALTALQSPPLHNVECVRSCAQCAACFRLVSATSAQIIDNSFLFASVHSSIFICDGQSIPNDIPNVIRQLK